MTIASLQFLGFAALAALIFNLRRVAWWQRGVMLIVNLAFLSTFSHDIPTYLPLLGFLVTGYAAVRLLQDERRAGWFVPVLLLLIVGFFWLKKYSFVPAELLIAVPYLTIGLSYIFFRVLHMVIDARDGSLRDRVGPVGFFNYTMNFTSLVSGPIQRYQDYAAQAGPTPPPLDWIAIGGAVERIAIGFVKVVVLGSILSGVHDRAMAQLPGAEGLVQSVATALALTVGYTFYLYCNFSGYTDIVIGVARFFRLELPENFNRPFSALNFMDFWARWHMTLSNWLKIYVYNPLLMSLMRRFPQPAIEPYLGVGAFFVTFFLIGLWHGQTSVFAVYGLTLGLGVSGNKLYQVYMIKALGRRGYRQLAAHARYQDMARGLTFTWFTLSLLFFWANWAQLETIATALGWAGIAALACVMFVLATVALALYEALRRLVLGISAGATPLVLHRYLRTVWVTTIGAITVAALLLMTSPAPDIIYKTF